MILDELLTYRQYSVLVSVIKIIELYLAYIWIQGNMDNHFILMSFFCTSTKISKEKSKISNF